jgi:hypothetical protein
MKVVKITGDNITTKPLNQNRMKAEIADWFIKFLYKNHTHSWDIFNDSYKLIDKKLLVPKKCKYCQIVEWRTILEK